MASRVLGADGDDAGSRRLQRSQGFVEEVRHKDFGMKNGRYVDCLSMELLHPNPPGI